MKAIDAVIHQNQDFLDALDEGAPLQLPRLERDAATKLLIDRMGRELDANPTAAQKVAKALGYANPAKLVRAIYKFSGKATWVTNDVAMLQATYEHMERTGQSFKEAVTDVSKHIPECRVADANPLTPRAWQSHERSRTSPCSARITTEPCAVTARWPRG